MKRLKMLPGAIMLLLCITALCFGIYAAKPVSHSIQGSINITAGDSLITISAYLNSYSNEIAEQPITLRGEGTLHLKEDSIIFNAGESYDAEGIAPLKLYIGITNHSNKVLGAYFVETPVNDGESTQIGNIATQRPLEGEDLEGNKFPGAVIANFQGYTEIPANETEVFLEIELILEKTGDYQMNVPIIFAMNVEPYNPPQA